MATWIPILSALIGGGTSLLGGILGSNAAGNAAETQANAATTTAGAMTDAAKIQADAILKAAGQANSLSELQNLLSQEMARPYTETGAGAVLTLKDLLQPGQYLAQGYPAFTGTMQFDPSKVTQDDPSFEFALKEGQKALERSAAARGNVLSGATAKAIERYAQDYSSTKYGEAYNRQYQAALNDYNQALERYGTNFNVDTTNKGNLYNRIANLAGLGQTSTTQLANTGASAAASQGANLQNATGNAANVSLAGTNAAQDALQAAAAARASGYVGGTNAWTSALGGLGNAAQYYSLYNLINKKP